jgi:hypothetical protein
METMQEKMDAIQKEIKSGQVEMRSAVSAIEKMDAWIAKMKDGQEKGDYG